MLPAQDALLLILVVVSMCALIAGELPDCWNDLRKFYAGWATRRPSADKTSEAAVPATAAQVTPVPKTPLQPPLQPQLQPPSHPAAQPALPLAADLLLVDDSAVARAKLRRLFEANGYTVRLACDGVEALALLDQGRYAMMITDLEMPNMDGITLVNRCLGQRGTRGMPILAVSGHENLRAKFNECHNICGVHRKPWADDILLSHVATLIGVRQVKARAVAMQ